MGDREVKTALRRIAGVGDGVHDLNGPGLPGTTAAWVRLEALSLAWKAVEEQVTPANESLRAALEATTLFTGDDPSEGLTGRGPTRSEGAVLRTLHAMLRRQDITIADLRKVVRPDGRIRWVHRRFERLYHGDLPTIP
nr:hypothetical protein [uncultured Actinoplanes sp.]